MLLTITATIVLGGTCHSGATACYDYDTGTIRAPRPELLDAYTITHELGHAHYFQTLTSQQRRDVAVSDPDVRDEEAYADVFAACVLGRGPRWLRSNGYGVRVGPSRFWRICNFIRRT